MHATIRRYEGVDTNRTDELSRKVSETLVPRLQNDAAEGLAGTLGRSIDATADGSWAALRSARGDCGMARFLHWHKMTWVLVLWSGYIAAWMVVSGSGPASVALWWFAGMIVFDLLWHLTQSRSRRARGLRGLFARPRPGQRRMADLRRSFWATEPRREQRGPSRRLDRQSFCGASFPDDAGTTSRH